MSLCRRWEDQLWDKAIGSHKGDGPHSLPQPAWGGGVTRKDAQSQLTIKEEVRGAAFGEDAGDNMLVTCWLHR